MQPLSSLIPLEQVAAGAQLPRVFTLATGLLHQLNRYSCHFILNSTIYFYHYSRVAKLWVSSRSTVRQMAEGTYR